MNEFGAGGRVEFDQSVEVCSAAGGHAWAMRLGSADDDEPASAATEDMAEPRQTELEPR